MAKTIKIRCTGSQKHENVVDLEKVLNPKPIVTYRGASTKPKEIPERLVLPCQLCADGKVVISRAMIEENLPGAER